MMFLSARAYFVLFTLLGIVYITGLFVPLMDNDAAHHAGIALHMHLTGDYASLVDHNGAYLDKPHLLFWLAAFSYKIFGVTSFAYKFPSLLFTLLGVYSTYRLGKLLYGTEVGKLAALLISTAFAYILSNSDVRMDAILTASIAFSTWQLAVFVNKRTLSAILGSAIGLALGFSTKGHIGVIVPLMSAFFYILYRRQWRTLIDPKWLLLLILFAVFIAPVVYCYYLQYNLHPETVVRGRDHINGVSFILWDQNFERFGGVMGQNAKNDYSFFLHSFLWAFAPWSAIVYIALVKRWGGFFLRQEEWLTTGTFTVMMLLVSLAGYKLPHYINILFPLAALMAAAFIISHQHHPKWGRSLFVIQLIFCLLIMLLVLCLHIWAFPLTNVLVIAPALLLAGILVYIIKQESRNLLQKAVLVPASVMIFSFFLLNMHFYPRLLEYQGGNQLAEQIRGRVSARNVYFWPGQYSPSFLFYTASLQQPFTDAALSSAEPVWVLADENDLPEIERRYRTGEIHTNPDYGITKLKLNFINPATRNSVCTQMVLVNIKGRINE